MPTTKALMALGAAAFASLPAVHALGCYNEETGLFGNKLGGTTFAMLHSSPQVYGSEERAILDEVFGDIAATCRQVDGSQVAPGQSWSRCSDWAYEAYDTTCSYNCENQCPGELRTVSGGLCDAGWECKGRCPTRVTDQGSSISWEIAHDGNGEQTRTMTFDICKKALEYEVTICPRGSESNHDGFWFKVDPNPIKC